MMNKRLILIWLVLVAFNTATASADVCYDIVTTETCEAAYGEIGDDDPCECNAQHTACSKMTYTDYAAEELWETAYGSTDPVDEGGYTMRTTEEFACLSAGSCKNECVSIGLFDWGCPELTRIPVSTIDDDSLSGAPCPP